MKAIKLTPKWIWFLGVVLGTLILVFTTSYLDREYDLDDFANNRAELIDRTFNSGNQDQGERWWFESCLSYWVGSGIAEDQWQDIREIVGDFKVLALVETGSPQFPLYDAQFIIKARETPWLVNCSHEPDGSSPSIKHLELSPSVLQNVMRELDSVHTVFEMESSIEPLFDGSCTFITFDFYGKRNQIIVRDMCYRGDRTCGALRQYMDSLFSFAYPKEEMKP